MGGKVIASVVGGLGNQLFQLGAGLAISSATGRELALDQTCDPGIVGPHPRPFQLHRLNTGIPIINRRGLGGLVWKNALFNKLGVTSGGIARSVLGVSIVKDGEPLSELVSKVNGASDDVILSGYFQSSWALLAGREVIRKGLRTVKLKPEAQELLDSGLGEAESVGVHVRRGDYLSIQSAPVEQEQYYESAIGDVRSKLKNPKFFVFSDDPDWAADWSARLGMTPVTCHSELEALEELRLLSACRHFILSNSSFSAWGLGLSDADQSSLVFASEKFVRTFGLDGQYRFVVS